MITIGESNINDFYFDITSNLNVDIISLLGGSNLNIKDVKTTTESTLILTNDCNVYGWGINQYGELGLGHNIEITELTHITSNISKIDCGKNHSLLLNLDGTVYSCGSNNFGQLGLSNYTDIYTLSNINLNNIEDISVGNDISLFKDTNDYLYFCGILKYEASNIQIACGPYHTMFLTESGNVYGCGENDYNQVNSSEGEYIEYIRKNYVNSYVIKNPTRVTEFDQLLNDGETITKIACGRGHTMYLTSLGNVYGCGYNYFNQVSSSGDDPINEPTKIEITDFPETVEIIQIACGSSHTMFLTSLGNVYGCGRNNFNQVSSSGDDSINEPAKIEITDFPETVEIIQIACGRSHTMFLTSMGNVYGCGDNNYRQVNTSNIDIIPQQTKITDFSPQLVSDETITEIACGLYHTMFLTSEGNVYGCGYNNFNQVSSSGDNPIDEPTKIEITDFDPGLASNEYITQIACGSEHTMFLTSLGNVYGCGWNYFNQINSSSDNEIIQPTKITDFPETVEIIQIACGRYYTMFLTSMGNVYGCGKNDYNQVSEISDDDDTVINKKKIDIYNEEIENKPTFFASNVKKILADNDFIYYVTNNNDIYKNYDFILRNSTFTDININDNKIYILNDIKKLIDVDTTNFVPIIPSFSSTWYEVIKFTHSSGSESQTSHTLTIERNTICDILIVGGGGGGGGKDKQGAGGGGAGACLFYKSFDMNVGTYTIKVGKGGIGTPNTYSNGTNGGDSEITNSLGTIFKVKGGGGGGAVNSSGNTGGCGGGRGSKGAGLGGIVATDYIINSITAPTPPNTEATNYIYYGNIGGRNTFSWDETNEGELDGAGGGGIGEGGTTTGTINLVDAQQFDGGKGGDGLYKATLNGVDYNFKDYFGINGIQEDDGHYYICGGGGGGDHHGQGQTGVGGNGGKGGGGSGGTYNSYGGTYSNRGNNATGYGSGGGGAPGAVIAGGGYILRSAGNGSSGIVIIRKYKTPQPIYENVSRFPQTYATSTALYNSGAKSAQWTDGSYTVKAKASEAWSGTTPLWYIFNNVVVSYVDTWHTNQKYVSNTTGNYTGTTTFKGVGGIYIVVDLGRPIYAFNLNIAPRDNSDYPSIDFTKNAPGLFKVYASNDPNAYNDNNHSSWTLILDQTTKKTYTNQTFTTFDLDYTNQYQYFAIVITHIVGQTISNYGYLLIGELYFNGAESLNLNPEYKTLTFTYDDTRYPKIDADEYNNTPYTLTFDNPTECDILIVGNTKASLYNTIELSGNIPINVGSNSSVGSYNTSSGSKPITSSITGISITYNDPIVIIRYKTKIVNTTSYNGTYNKITKGFDNLFFKSLDNNIYTLNQTTNNNYGTTKSELSFNKLEFFTDKIVDNIFSSKHKDITLFVTSNNLIYNSGDLIYNSGDLILQNTDNNPKLINDIFDTDLVNIIRYKNDDGYYLRYSDKVLDNDKNKFIVGNIDSNNIKKIDRTINSTVILTKEGTVYIDGTINSISYNRIINIAEEIIIDISCGYEHVLFRTANKKLYVLGDNSQKQLGIDYTTNVDDDPVNIDINSEEIQDIICGYYNSIVKTNNNYYITGNDGTTQYSGFTETTYLTQYTDIKKIIARNSVSILDGTTFHGKNEDGTSFTQSDIEDVYVNNSNIFFKKTDENIINENGDTIYSHNDSLTINKGIIDNNDNLLLSYKNNDFKIDPDIEYPKEWIYTSNSTYYMGNVAIGKTTATDKLDIAGELSTNYGKQFKITHPLDSNLWLYHSSIECPRNDNIYRGETIIKNGYVEVNIDKECNTTGGMIEGTFKKLNKNSQLFLQNNDTFDNVKGNIDNNIIKIYCENKNKDIKVNWIVIGERDDEEIKKLEITDISGCLICEHLISR